MIDYFAIGLTHALLLLGIWRLLGRDDLDHDQPAAQQRQAAEPPGDA